MILSSEMVHIAGVSWKTDEPLAGHTSMGVGGPASFLALVDNSSALESLLAHLKQTGQPWFILGGGTNTIFTDAGFPGVVISLSGEFNGICPESPQVIRVGAATPLSTLVNTTVRMNLSGLEFCHGIPGQTGGAVAGNAGADGRGILDAVLSIRGITPGGEWLDLRPGADCAFSYRHYDGPEMIITSLRIRLQPADPAVQTELLEKYRRIRSGQPASKGVSGSIFKNPPGDFAGRLIDLAGLKGAALGGAVVSPRHGNWIINTGGATASDVIGLLEKCRSAVRYSFGVVLEPEVRIVHPFAPMADV